MEPNGLGSIDPNVFPLDAFALTGAESDTQRLISLKDPWYFDGERVSYPQSGYVAGRGWWQKHADGTLVQWGYFASYSLLPAGAAGWKVINMPIPAMTRLSCSVITSGWPGISATMRDAESTSQQIQVYDRGGYLGTLGTTDGFWIFYGRWKA